MSSKSITLESNPIEKDYEDYISAFFQSGGLYVERSIIHREKEEILELDIITTDFGGEEIKKRLIEIKSGNWGFHEIFKVKGWLVFLNLDEGVFIVKKSRDSFDYFQEKSSELSIELLDNSDLSRTNECLSKFLHQEVDEKELVTLRFSYLLERKLLKQLKQLKKDNPNNIGFQYLDDYFFKINSGSFFSRNPISRIRQLFETFLKYKNITAKIGHELETGVYDEEITELSDNYFRKIFYKTEESPLYISLYVEHMARVTILKACAEHLITKHKDSFGSRRFIDIIEYLNIPNTIKRGLNEIVNEPYFHRYPIFWQFFTYVMGGFILEDLKDAEYQYISDNTGIPVEEIPNAFESFNKLFPKNEGWMFSIPKTNISWHRFFPVPFCGVGANHRRFIHNEGKEETYDELEKLLSGNKTMTDLKKWNDLGYNLLK